VLHTVRCNFKGRGLSAVPFWQGVPALQIIGKTMDMRTLSH
jgi:hypothetical protein